MYSGFVAVRVGEVRGVGEVGVWGAELGEGVVSGVRVEPAAMV
jgi:hypothetical protein